MYLLDTNLVSLLQGGNAEADALRRWLGGVASEGVATTIVCYEEQMRG